MKDNTQAMRGGVGWKRTVLMILPELLMIVTVCSRGILGNRCSPTSCTLAAFWMPTRCLEKIWMEDKERKEDGDLDQSP